MMTFGPLGEPCVHLVKKTLGRTNQQAEDERGIIATRPAPSSTASLDSERWCSGKNLWMNNPSTRRRKMHAKAINAIVTELMVSFVWRASYGGAQPNVTNLDHHRPRRQSGAYRALERAAADFLLTFFDAYSKR
jgi:hypothetical protein